MGLPRSFTAGRGTTIRSVAGRPTRKVQSPSLGFDHHTESREPQDSHFCNANPFNDEHLLVTSNKFAKHWSRSHSPSPLSTAESVKVGQIITPSAYISSPTRMILPEAIMICDIAKMKREFDLNRAVGFVLARDCGSRIMGCERKVVRSF